MLTMPRNLATQYPKNLCSSANLTLPFYPKAIHFISPHGIHYEVELVVRINRLGKHIEEQFASRYYDEIGLGIDFTARDVQDDIKTRDVQDDIKKKGHPWEKAKGFDGSAIISDDFISVSQIGDLQNVAFSLKKNKGLVQQGNSKDMIHTIDKIINYVSQYMTLKIGDYIFTGTPAGVGKVIMGDVLEGFIGEQKMFAVKVK